MRAGQALRAGQGWGGRGDEGAPAGSVWTTPRDGNVKIPALPARRTDWNLVAAPGPPVSCLREETKKERPLQFYAGAYFLDKSHNVCDLLHILPGREGDMMEKNKPGGLKSLPGSPGVMTMLNRCPGSLAGTPTLKVKKCPECGSEVEVFSNDVKVNCEKCGFAVYNDVESCIQWCKYARECVGEQLYKKLKRYRVAFVGAENTTRSVLAEALAKDINTSPKLGFVSAGTRPADTADPAAAEALEGESITWHGKPKDVARIGLADIFVLMGPEVELPEELKRTRVMQWDIPNPRGKGSGEYRQAIQILREKITELIREVEENG